MSHRQPANRPPWSPNRILWLGVVAVLLVGGRVAAQDKVPPKPNDDPPPVQILADIQPRYLALLTIGAACQPQLGPVEATTLLRLGEHPALRVWSIEDPLNDPKIRGLIGRATLALGLLYPPEATILTELVLVKAGDKFDCWTLINTDEVRSLPRDLLIRVRDREGIPKPLDNDLELDAYFEMLIWAGRTSARAFERAARHDLTYRHLFEEPGKNRGQVVHLEGKLKRLDRYEAPQQLRQAGFPDLYEAWIFAESYGANPFCVLVTELPPNLEVGEKLDVQVSFDGYFYKRYRYRAGDNLKANERRDAPLLIGRTIKRLGPLPPADDNWGKGLVSLAIWFFAGAAGFVLVLVLWYRHTDRKVQQRLAGLRNQEFVVPTPEDEKISSGEVTNPQVVSTENEVEKEATTPAPFSAESLLRQDRPGL